jgi:hypothetical protein
MHNENAEINNITKMDISLFAVSIKSWADSESQYSRGRVLTLVLVPAGLYHSTPLYMPTPEVSVRCVDDSVLCSVITPERGGFGPALASSLLICVASRLSILWSWES